MDWSYYQQDWANATPEQSNYIEPPDGKYRVRITKVTFDEEKNQNGGTNPRLTYELEILDGEYSGSSFRKFDHIRTARSFNFIKGDLMTLQVPTPADLNDLSFVLNGAVNSIIEVQVKTTVVNGTPYKNCYIKRLLEMPGQQQQRAPQMQQPQIQPQQPVVQQPVVQQPQSFTCQPQRQQPQRQQPQRQQPPQGMSPESQRAYQQFGQPGFNDENVPF